MKTIIVIESPSPGLYKGKHSGKKTHIWVTNDGRQIPVKWLTDEHLNHIITCVAKHPLNNRKVLKVLVKELNRRNK